MRSGGAASSGADSVPLLTSTAWGRTARTASATVSGRRPPARTIGPSWAAAAARSTSARVPEPPPAEEGRQAAQLLAGDPAFYSAWRVVPWIAAGYVMWDVRQLADALAAPRQGTGLPGS